MIGTRVAQFDGRQHLELRINVPLAGASERQRAQATDRAIRAITTDLLAAGR